MYMLTNDHLSPRLVFSINLPSNCIFQDITKWYNVYFNPIWVKPVPEACKP